MGINTVYSLYLSSYADDGIVTASLQLLVMDKAMHWFMEAKLKKSLTKF